MVEEAKATIQLSSELESAAKQRASERANVAKWQLNIAVFLFAILIIIMVLLSQGIGVNVVAPVAIFGLTTVWVMGWKRARELYQRFLSEEISNLEQKPAREASTLTAPLTPRESEILRHVAQGHANKRIALELGISEDTVKTHVARILAKLNANDRTEAAVIAIKKGFISVE